MKALGMMKSGGVVATMLGGLMPLVAATTEESSDPAAIVPMTQVEVVMLTHAAEAACCFSPLLVAESHTVQPVTGATGDVQDDGRVTVTVQAEVVQPVVEFKLIRISGEGTRFDGPTNVIRT